MHPLILAAACKGDWQQKLQCGWHQPTTTAANAGSFAGHNVAPFLAVALIVLLVALARRGGSRKTVTGN